MKNEQFEYTISSEDEVIKECQKILFEKFKIHSNILFKKIKNGLSSKKIDVLFYLNNDAPLNSGEFKILYSNAEKKKITIYAKGIYSLFGGIGYVLKHIHFKNNDIDIELENIVRIKPKSIFRGCLCANHPFRNNYCEWDVFDWQDYIKDMALWGNNIIWTDGMEIFPGVIPYNKPPEYLNLKIHNEWKRQSSIQGVLPNIARKFGLEFGIWYPPNGIYEMQVDNLLKKGIKIFANDFEHRKYVCPSNKRAREIILYERECMFSRFSRIDHFFVPSADNGGCVCSSCQPWVKTYLELCEEQYKILQKYHPGAKLWVSNQKLGENQTRILCEELKKSKYDWIYGIVFGPHGWNLKYLYEKLHKRYKILLYSDITHTSRSQYQMLNSSYPLNIIVGREALIGVRPHEFNRIFLSTIKYSDGISPYSEGIYDDFNKFLWSSFVQDEEKTCEEIIMDYATMYFGYNVRKKFLELVLLLEKNWITDIKDNIFKINEALLLIEEIYYDIKGSFKFNNWRLEIFRMECMMFKLVWLWLVKGRKNKKFQIFFNKTLKVREYIYSLCKLKMVPDWSFKWMNTEDYNHEKCIKAKDNLIIQGV